MRRPTHGGPRSHLLRRGWAREDGIALVLSMIVMGVLTIATTAVVTAVTSNEHAFGRDRQTNRALNIAEAGLNAGVAAVKALPATATTMSPASGTLDNGSWAYTVTRTQDATNPDLYYWTVTSTGTSPDGMVTRIVSTKVSETITHHSTTTTTTTPASPAWAYGFFLGDPSSDCATLGTGNDFGGNYTISVSIYIAGSLCMQGSNVVMREPGTGQQTLDLYVGDIFKVTGSNSSPIGTSTQMIRQATIVNGCLDHSGRSVPCSKRGDPTANPQSPSYGSGVWAGTYSSTQNPIPTPTIEADKWYADAAPGPATGCNDHPTDPSQTSVYPSGWTAATFRSALFDNNSTRDTSLGTLDPLSAFGTGSFDCRWYDGAGNLVGRLAWTYGNPGTLTIDGTVFIDGNLSFASNDYAIVQGRGTIYVNGTVSFSGQAKVCELPTSGDPCLGNYDPSQNLLVLVANNGGSHTTTGFALSGLNTYEGVAYTNGILNEGGNATLHGPVIADTATMAGNGATRTTVTPPEGAPGAAGTTTSTTDEPDTAAWGGVPGSWQQLK
jgi:Tfp pilus assembly protein PilX